MWQRGRYSKLIDSYRRTFVDDFGPVFVVFDFGHSKKFISERVAIKEDRDTTNRSEDIEQFSKTFPLPYMRREQRNLEEERSVVLQRNAEARSAKEERTRLVSYGSKDVGSIIL